MAWNKGLFCSSEAFDLHADEFRPAVQFAGSSGFHTHGSYDVLDRVYSVGRGGPAGGQRWRQAWRSVRDPRRRAAASGKAGNVRPEASGAWHQAKAGRSEASGARR